MSSTLKVCPICQTSHPSTAMTCRVCGASLAKVDPVARVVSRTEPDETEYDFRYGENDLMEQPLSRRGQTCFTIAVTALVAFLMGGVFVAAAPSLLNRTQATPVPTNTVFPTPALATVTQGPPTASPTYTPQPTNTPAPTNTPGPCIQTIQSGGSLYGVIAACGYRDSDVILPTVMALNGISDAAALQIGQQIIVPWPSPTTDPNAVVPTSAASASTQAGDSASASNEIALDESIDAFAPTAIPTLPAGVMWHRIQPSENLATISDSFGVSMKTLSELNPEMDFGQCDFGSPYGGPSCNVIVSIGQDIRVPAPSPTPTLPPTPDPNATATPTPTATYNEPFAISPTDRQFFGRDELVTLRWTPTGVLAADEWYRVDVQDLTSGIAHTAYTREITFVIPTEWQGTLKPRHDFTWTVAIVNDADRSQKRFTTAPRVFVWQGLVDESETKKK